MSTTSNLGTILRFYANRQESAFINYRDFCEYLKKYSARHLEEQPELIKYMESPEAILYSELKGLAEKKEVYLLNFDTNKTAVLCGPPIMIKFTLEGLCAIGFDKTNIYTTLELRMKCGVGKCGRCNVGAKYVCKDGPVFRCDELDELPAEY